MDSHTAPLATRSIARKHARSNWQRALRMTAHAVTGCALALKATDAKDLGTQAKFGQFPYKATPPSSIGHELKVCAERRQRVFKRQHLLPSRPLVMPGMILHTTMSTDSIAPCLPYELIEDLVVHLLAHILHRADASTILPSFLSPTLAHTLLCILPTPPPSLTSLVFIRLKHCHPTAFAARGDPLLIRRVAREHHLARVTFRHWHRSPWSLSQTAAHYECSEIEWLQSVAAGASRGNQVHVLDWLVRQPEAKGYIWKLVCTSAAVVNVSSNPVVVASAYGAVLALEWWRQALKEHGWMRCERASKLAIECMALAAARGHVDTVRWWAGQVGANMSEGSIWEQVQVPLKRLGMDSDRFKGILAAARMPTGSPGFALKMGASP